MASCPQCGRELTSDSVEGICGACLLVEALETQVTGPPIASTDARPAPMAGIEDDSFGNYEILSLIGEGGMGSVYLANQIRPIRRQVALKVVKLGMDTRQIVNRFESERQALALMDHPNIARVYEAGTSAKGRPYFVMEYVEGEPITQYCDRRLLNTRERLELFGPVCQALQHAHQKGVIHRDVKPSNALVAEVDGKPLPKVIDFGIAKATDQRLAEQTAFTLLGQFVGTPEYMSPEQADLSSPDIDTGSDIYSLGILLYELLVGALPFDAKWLRAAGLAELLRIIREEERPTPSNRLTKLGATAIEVARCRRTDPAALRRQLTGDLNWIVMKAIEKDRRRRYASVSELAADIRRHLDDHPILAGPPSSAYRMGKFLRRHRVAAAAGAVIAASLVAGIVATSWEARVAEARRQEAESQRRRADAGAAQARREGARAEEQRKQAEFQRNEADSQRRRAEDLFTGVRGLANSMLFEVNDQIATLAGATAAREVLVRKAAAYLDTLAQSAGSNPQLQEELAAAYLKLGDLQGHPLLPSLDDPVAARRSYSKCIEIASELSRTAPKNFRVQHLLIQAHQRRSFASWLSADRDSDRRRALELAEARYRKDPASLEARRDLAFSLNLSARWARQEGDPGRAEQFLLRARAFFDPLFKADPEDFETVYGLGENYVLMASAKSGYDREGAVRETLFVLDLCDTYQTKHPTNSFLRRARAEELVSLGALYVDMNRTQEGLARGEQGVKLMRELAESDPRNRGFRLERAVLEGFFSRMLLAAGKRLEGMTMSQGGLSTLRQLVAEQPEDPEIRFQLAEQTLWASSRLGWSGDPIAALEAAHKSEAQMEELVGRYPDRADYHRLLAEARFHVGAFLQQKGDLPGGITKHRQNLAEVEKLAAHKGAGDLVWADVAGARVALAGDLDRLGDQPGRLQEYLLATNLYEKVASAHPESKATIRALAQARYELARAYVTQRNWGGAQASAGKALAFWEAEYAAAPNNPGFADRVSVALLTIAESYSSLSDHKGALEQHRRILAIWEHQAAFDPSDASRGRWLAAAFNNIGNSLRASGDRKGALENFHSAEAVLSRYSAEELNLPANKRWIAGAYLWLVRDYSAIGEDALAEAVHLKLLPLLEDLNRIDPNDRTTRNDLIESHRAVAWNLYLTGKLQEALGHFISALNLRLGRNPSNFSEWQSAAAVQRSIAIIYGRRNRSDAMQEELKKAIELFEKAYSHAREQAARNQSKDQASLRNMVASDQSIMGCYHLLKDAPKVAEFSRRALEDARSLNASFPQVTGPLIQARQDASRLEWERTGEKGDYAPIFGPDAPTPRTVRFFTAYGFKRLGDELSNDDPDSYAAYGKAVGMFEQLVRDDPKNADNQIGLAATNLAVAQNYMNDSRRGGSDRPSNLQHACESFKRSRGILLDLEAEKRLPPGWSQRPGQIAASIQTCEALLAAH